jgi:hypothetical protein
MQYWWWNRKNSRPRGEHLVRKYYIRHNRCKFCEGLYSSLRYPKVTCKDCRSGFQLGQVWRIVTLLRVQGVAMLVDTTESKFWSTLCRRRNPCMTEWFGVAATTTVKFDNIKWTSKYVAVCVFEAAGHNASNCTLSNCSLQAFPLRLLTRSLHRNLILYPFRRVRRAL